MSASQSKEGDPAAVPSEAGSSSTTQQTSSSEQFDIVKHYAHLLEQDDVRAATSGSLLQYCELIIRSRPVCSTWPCPWLPSSRSRRSLHAPKVSESRV